ncbi:MAG TPA: patatin-like phospholipase family protein [Vicinamibacterales bacterium]|jgi:hypothetical protein|nr:patatin-like phospholipase family protein [Vicinamibacterales bacterium]
MTPRAEPASPIGDSYSPQLRTALVLTGTGTAGAYHAGVLRALHEAGVKIDIVAGHGMGAVAALFAAVDGAARLWDEKGFWRSPAVRRLYPWRPALRVAALALLASVAIVCVPIAAVAAGLVVFPVDFVLKMIGLGGAGGLVSAYVRFAESAFAPAALPTWLPRLVLLVLGGAAAVTIAGSWKRDGRRRGGAWPWLALRPPLSADAVVDHCWRVMWDLVRGATALREPPARELAHRYTELLSENFGQPGFRELLLGVHDVDAHRDLVFALVAERRRKDLVRRPSSAAADRRRAEVFDLSGVAREHLADAVAAALAVPLATDHWPVTFAADGYWRGETHRLADRPGLLARLLDELADLGVEQILVVSAAPETPGPHALTAPRLDGRGRIGEAIQSAEAAVVHDALRAAAARVKRLFTVRPVHNPIGPFDFGGGYDDRSDRRQPLVELMGRGYEDAYRQFIEPVVAASGERVGAI